MADKVVFYVCILSGAFFLGMWAGEERAAVELMPCPKEMGFSIVSRTATTCNYVRSSQLYGKAINEKRI